MQFFVAILALAGIASASILARQANLPNCAASCLATADYGSCSPVDNRCLCNNSAFISSATACIEKTCQGDDLTNAINGSVALCKAVGVTLSTPSATGAASTGASASAAATATSIKASSASSSAASATSTSKSGAMSNSVNVLVGAAALGLAALI